MNDLLPESCTQDVASNHVELRTSSLKDIEMGDAIALKSHSNLVSFFEEVELIKNEMRKIKQLLSKLQEANEESKTVHQADAMKALRERMDCDVEDVLKKAKSIKVKLENLDKVNTANRENTGCGEGSPVDRTRTSVTHSLRKKLMDLMEDFQVLRHRIIAQYRQTIERRYFTMTGEMPDDVTVEKIMETGESENLVQKAIQEQGKGHIFATIIEIHERHGAVKEIEKNLLELHQIFLDMAVLVEAQGEQLNDIEHYVNMAASFVEKGKEQLQTAKKYQKHRRNWIIVSVSLSLIVIIIMIAVILVATLRKS